MNTIEVSVICQVYNHGKYLRKCLEGFVSQKTDFSFEIIIHDDKSADDSADIIREYEKKYPNLFVAIYEEENQYSRKKMIIRDIMLPLARGRLLAFCEGDDYWCDENKLQKQYEYMLSDHTCIMCTHNTLRHFLEGNKEDELFNDWKGIHVLTEEDVFAEGKVHTSSKMIYKECFEVPEFATKYWFGDLVNLTWTFQKGKIVSLPDVMSVYNSGVEGGATDIALNSDPKTIEYKHNQLLQYYSEYNKETGYKYDKYISRRIKERKYAAELIRLDNMYDKCKTRREFWDCGNNARNDPIYHRMIRENMLIRPVMTIKIALKFRFPYLWSLIKHGRSL